MKFEGKFGKIKKQERRDSNYLKQSFSYKRKQYSRITLNLRNIQQKMENSEASLITSIACGFRYSAIYDGHFVKWVIQNIVSSLEVTN